MQIHTEDDELAIRINSQSNKESDSDIYSVDLSALDGDSMASKAALEESFMQVEDVLEGLNWFTRLQI